MECKKLEDNAVFLFIGHVGDELLHEARRGNGGNAGGIIRGRDLHHVIAHDIQICQTAHQLQGLGGGEAAGYGRTGSRRIGGIQEVNVEGQEALALPTRARMAFRTASMPILWHSSARSTW